MVEANLSARGDISLLIEVKRAATGNKEYYEQFPNGDTVQITKEEYDAKGGGKANVAV